jgi:hypothetical protein
MSESFHVNVSYFGSVVLKKNISNDLSKSLHFCDYLPFGKDLALY